MQIDTNHFENNNDNMVTQFGILGLFLSFIGGAIGGLTATPKIITFQIFHDPMLFDFIIRSLIGGLIGLSVKVIGDVAIQKIREKKENKKSQSESEEK